MPEEKSPGGPVPIPEHNRSKPAEDPSPLTPSPGPVQKPRAMAGARRKGNRSRYSRAPRFAALDLGTNNCRLLIAAPRGRQFRIVDAFSRIVRLGENLIQSGRLSDAAMDRTVDVLKICAEKIKDRNVTHMRCVATQACRGAVNGQAFLDRVKTETGLTLEIIDPAEEARLAMLGCKDLFDPASDGVLVFDIGGGSTEISWIRQSLHMAPEREIPRPVSSIAAWSSLPFGVVSLAEKWGGRDLSRETYDTIVNEVRIAVEDIGDKGKMRPHFDAGTVHLLGTSGTITSIAGVHLKLDRYRRTAVDGLWISRSRTVEISEKLRAMSFEQRANEPCIGRERADLVVCGCAILQAIMDVWPADRIRVADRGLREGILTQLASDYRRRR